MNVDTRLQIRLKRTEGDYKRAALIFNINEGRRLITQHANIGLTL